MFLWVKWSFVSCCFFLLLCYVCLTDCISHCLVLHEIWCSICHDSYHENCLWIMMMMIRGREVFTPKEQETQGGNQRQDWLLYHSSVRLMMLVAEITELRVSCQLFCYPHCYYNLYFCLFIQRYSLIPRVIKTEMRRRHQRKETGGYFRLTLFVNLCCFLEIFLDICTHAANPGERKHKYHPLTQHSFCIYKSHSLEMAVCSCTRSSVRDTWFPLSNASLEKEPVIFLWFPKIPLMIRVIFFASRKRISSQFPLFLDKEIVLNACFDINSPVWWSRDMSLNDFPVFPELLLLVHCWWQNLIFVFCWFCFLQNICFWHDSLSKTDCVSRERFWHSCLVLLFYVLNRLPMHQLRWRIHFAPRVWNLHISELAFKLQTILFGCKKRRKDSRGRRWWQWNRLPPVLVSRKGKSNCSTFLWLTWLTKTPCSWWVSVWLWLQKQRRKFRSKDGMKGKTHNRDGNRDENRDEKWNERSARGEGSQQKHAKAIFCSRVFIHSLCLSSLTFLLITKTLWFASSFKQYDIFVSRLKYICFQSKSNIAVVVIKEAMRQRRLTEQSAVQQNLPSYWSAPGFSSFSLSFSCCFSYSYWLWFFSFLLLCPSSDAGDGAC